MPKDKRVEQSVNIVELNRLQALVETQRRHIEELNQQLHEALEVKRQQQLQLIEQSPARRNVRQMLARAAADNTALCKKVEELRAQRNALAVTKAALTAQLSELIRGAAGDSQHKLLLEQLQQQLQQVCKAIGKEQLQEPTQQMAAVIAFVQQASQEQQVMQADVNKYKQEAAKLQCMEATAAADANAHAHASASAALSPTGQQLDKTATSQLIWDSKQCPDLFQQSQTAAADAAANGTPAASMGSAWSDGGSYLTARSCMTDMSYISPMRGSCSSSRVTRDEVTPCSRTPAGSIAAAGAADGGVVGSPLSCQSLSMFSSSKASTPGTALNPRRLELSTPVLKLDNALVRDQQGSSGSSLTSSLQGLETPATAIRVGLQQPTDSPQPPMLLMSPVFGISQELLDCPPVSSSRGLGAAATQAAAGAAVAPTTGAVSSRPAGLFLESEFRIAACDSLWPSPAVAGTAAEQGAAGSRGSSCSSHMLWLPFDDDDACPEAVRLALDFPPVSDGDQQQQKRSSSKRRWLVVSLCVVAPLTIAAAIGSAAAWNLKREEVEVVMGVLKHGAIAAAQHTQHGAAVGWRACQQGAAAACAKVKQLMSRSRGGGGRIAAGRSSHIKQLLEEEPAAEQ